MIDPRHVCLFIPANLKRFKLDLFERIGRHIEKLGGKVIRHDIAALENLPDKILPIVGCMPELTALITKWKATGRNRIQWDRGYCRRVFATWLPRADTIEKSYYRWHVNHFQLRHVEPGLSPVRWNALKIPLKPWQKNGRHVVVAAPTPTYEKFHQIEGWTDRTIRYLSSITERQVVVRQKESKRPLQYDLDGAHCLVANGSIAAVEAAILGCPVFDNVESAAALVGLTDLAQIERPIYPDRQPWANALAESQFNETELVDGTLWRFLT